VTPVEVELLTADEAADIVLVQTIVGIMNRAYATAEIALWKRPVGRTTIEETTGWIAEGAIAVARSEDRIVGAVCLKMIDDVTGWFGALSVDPDAQGRGVASAMLRFVERHLRVLGADRIEIEVLVPESPEPHSSRLLAWYRAVGYVETHRRRLAEFDPRAVEDALLDIDLAVMHKQLA
jgi:GNAT superfamily N-acetyltransferase